MRARMSLVYSGIDVELREIILRDKPDSMLAYSPKGTVPVLVVADSEKDKESDGERVIDESLDVILWALAQHDPDDLLLANDADLRAEADALIHENDNVFKQNLDRYKYFVRYPEHPQEHYRSQGEVFLQSLDDRLQANTTSPEKSRTTSQNNSMGQNFSGGPYLLADRMTVADIAVCPFIRQFVNVDKAWFDQAPYTNLRAWLEMMLSSSLFVNAMNKYAQWQEGDIPTIFPQV